MKTFKKITLLVLIILPGLLEAMTVAEAQTESIVMSGEVQAIREQNATTEGQSTAMQAWRVMNQIRIDDVNAVFEANNIDPAFPPSVKPEGLSPEDLYLRLDIYIIYAALLDKYRAASNTTEQGVWRNILVNTLDAESGTLQTPGYTLPYPLIVPDGITASRQHAFVEMHIMCKQIIDLSQQNPNATPSEWTAILHANLAN